MEMPPSTLIKHDIKQEKQTSHGVPPRVLQTNLGSKAVQHVELLKARDR